MLRVIIIFQTFQQSTVLTPFVSSAASGITMSIIITPIDVIATRLFNQGAFISIQIRIAYLYNIYNKSCFITYYHFLIISGVSKDGKGLFYANIYDCFMKTFKAEGIYGFYKGFVPICLKYAPRTIITLTSWDLLKK